MNYFKNKEVVIKLYTGKFVPGVIIDSALGFMIDAWWVTYDLDGRANTDLFSEKELNDWNVVSLDNYCVCGSIKTNQPGHSYYCNLK